MNRITRWSIGWTALAIAAAGLVGACSSAAGSIPENRSNTRTQPAPATAPKVSNAATEADGGIASAARSVAPGAPAVAPAQPPTGETAGQPQTAGNFDARLIIYNAQLRLGVDDVAATVREITRIAGESCAGGVCGFVGESNFRLENDRQVGTIAIQVPAERYGDVLNRIRELGQKIVSETSKSQDVTEEFTDRQSELRSLRASEDRYLQLLGEAKTVQDILTLEDRLRAVRTQIEKTQGRVNFLQKRSALATITVDLTPMAALAPPPLPRSGLVVVAERAWASSLQFLNGVASVVVAVAVFFWWLIPFVIVALILARGWLVRATERVR